LSPEGEVGLYFSPWVSGTRVVAYFGQISVVRFYRDCRSYDLKIELVLRALQRKALETDKSANAVVGLDLWINPFAERGGETMVEVGVVGTVGRLERLF
jgi:hypothetical protein